MATYTLFERVWNTGEKVIVGVRIGAGEVYDPYRFQRNSTNASSSDHLKIADQFCDKGCGLVKGDSITTIPQRINCVDDHIDNPVQPWIQDQFKDYFLEETVKRALVLTSHP